MTDRALGVIAAAAGMVLVTLLMLRGVDLARAAQMGPRWRRRLVTAGIAVLTACGVQAATPAAPPVPACYSSPVIPVSQRTIVDLRAQFELLDGMLAAAMVNTDTALVTMRTVEEDINRLTDTATFAALPAEQQDDVRDLLADAQTLLDEVRDRREELAAPLPPVICPAGPPVTAGYVMVMPQSSGRDAVMRLALQIALLRQQVAGGTIATDTAQGIIHTIENDLRQFDEAGVFSAMAQDEEEEARRKIREAQALLVEAQAMTGTPAQLAGSRAWQEYRAVRAAAEGIVAHERGAYPFDQAGKTKIIAGLSAAAGELDALGAAGLLALPEAELLKKDLKELVDGVMSFRTTELQLATCYAPMPLRNPAEQGMTRVNDRLALLRQLAEQQTLHADALQPVIDDLRADIAVLTAPANIHILPVAQRAAAEEARQAAQQALADIERQLAGQ